MLHVSPLGFLSFPTGGYVPAGAIWLDGSADYLTWTPSSGSSNTAFTFSFWTKRAGLGAYGAVLAGTTTAAQSDFIRFGTSNTFETIGDDGNDWTVVTSAVYRDTTAWEHWVVSFNNTTDVRIWNDGVEITSFSTNIESGTMGGWLRATAQYVGRNGAGQSFNGYLAEVIALDGTAVTDALDFGEYDTNGNWVPIDPTTFVTANKGTNGFWLDFADSANLGNDVSGNNNDFTPTSMSAANSTSDRPADDATNGFGNYATWSPISKAGMTSNATFSEGNMRASSGATGCNVQTTIAVGSGKWYCEFLVNSAGSNYPLLGVSDPSIDENGWVWVGAGVRSGDGYKTDFPFDSSDAYGAAYTSGTDVVMCAMDLDNGAVWMGLNGTWWNSATASEIAAGTTTNALSTTAEWAALGDGTPLCFGAGLYTADVTLRTKELDWSYSAPTGFKALNTANLPAPTVTDPSGGFDIALDTETNIASAMSTVRSGWANWVELAKNRSNVETWSWRFSHDTSNEHAMSSAANTGTTTYQSMRTLSGSDNWAGFVLKIDSTYGTAAGSQAHTNGVATTVTHNLGNARQIVLLFERDSAKDTYMYHPDLTSGSLLILNKHNAEAASTQITNVTANSFDIGSGAATQTYDYLVLAETSGFISMGSFTGNASTDGPVNWAGHQPAFLAIKDRDTTGDHTVWRDNGPGYNPTNDVLFFDENSAENTSGNAVDLLAGGFKLRSAGGDVNSSGGVFTWFSIARFPFGGSGVAQARAR